MVGLLALLVLATGLSLGGPQILRTFIDQATGGAALATLARLAALYLGVVILGQLASIGETYLAENIGQAATNALRADLTRHCVDLDLAWHRARTPGELIERVDGDVANLANFFSRFVVQLLGNAVLLIGVLALLFAVHPAVGGGIALCALISLVTLYRMRNLGVPAWDKARQANAELFGFLEERLAGTEDLRASAAVDHTLFRLAERSAAVLRTERWAALVGSLTYNAGELLLTVTTIVGLGLSGLLFLQGTLTIGAVFLVFSYTQVLTRPVEQIARQLQDLQRAAASLARIRGLFATSSSIDWSGQQSLPVGPLAVEVEHVSFDYGDGRPALSDVVLTIQPGEVVGLLGRTGSGKTSLARLLGRFYDPTSGNIRLGGVDLRRASLDEVRRSVGIVTQDVQLFHATLRDNLTLFDPSVPDRQIQDVLQSLGLGDWLAELPGGLDTLLLQGGNGLSAGEAQLLACARTFLRDPGLVILDEASSRLDPATERRIEAALDRLLAGRTALIIAHRLATVQRADTIVILDDGAVVEAGPRIALARNSASRFAGLLAVGLAEVLQ